MQKLEDYNNNIDVLLTENLYPINKDTYHFMVHVLKSTSRQEHALLSHILNIAYKAEQLSQGGGPMVLRLLMGYIKYVRQHDLMHNRSFWLRFSQNQAQILSSLQNQVRECCIPGTEEFLNEGIQKICRDEPIISKVALKALELAGLEGKIFTENSLGSKFLLECKNGYAFKAKTFTYFLTNKRWCADNCKVMLVDGFVEKVSELDSVLQKCYETKQPTIIVASGFSEEVVATLKVNQERGNFDCLPVRIMPDIESLNMINDIAVVCGTTPISSLKGEMLCFVKHEQLPTVEKVELTQQEMIIHNSATLYDVSVQIRSIMEKKNDPSLLVLEDMQEVLNKRIKSLISNSVVIHLPNSSKMSSDNYRIMLDNCFRYAKSIINYGIVNTSTLITKLRKDIHAEHENQQLIYCCNSALEYALQDVSWTPTLSLIGSIQLSISLLTTFFSAGGMVSLT
jgi:hypothetical protein